MEATMKEMTESEAADHFYDKWLFAVAKNKRLENDIVVLEGRIKKLEDALYAAERQANVDMGR
jgi:hypothetical protein